MVDQLRLPQFWNNAAVQNLIDSQCPGIRFLRMNSVVFTNYFACATQCTPARATMLTGLYAPQTAQFLTGLNANQPPDLDTRYPTFGSAVADLNPLYAGQAYWWGKWHLSQTTNLGPYGFNTASNLKPTYPGTSPSPNGTANQGNNGNQALGGDSWIANDFDTNWPSAGGPASQWLSVISFINPHDIGGFAKWFPRETGCTINNNPDPYCTLPGSSNPVDGYNDFPPSSAVPVGQSTPYSASSLPAYWNFEDQTQLQAKGISLQTFFQALLDDLAGPGDDTATLTQYFDYYIALMGLVDQQIQAVLNTLGIDNNHIQNPTLGNPLTDTVIVFTADHGDYSGSHGLRTKGGGVYDEALRLPLYAMLPAQQGQIVQEQMCSSVDFFRFVVELATGDSLWTAANPKYGNTTLYLDQADRQSLADFIWTPGQTETRTVSINGTPTPYILTTTDEAYAWALPSGYPCAIQNHVTGFRLKSLDDSGQIYTGAKVAVYGKWQLGKTKLDTSVPEQWEFYDYTNFLNRAEMGNDYLRLGQNSSSLALFNAMTAALATLNTGLLYTELWAALQGSYPNDSNRYPGRAGTALSTVMAHALGAYDIAIYGTLTSYPQSCTS